MVKMDMTFTGRIKQSIRSCTFNDIKVHLVLVSVCLIFSVFYIVTKKALDNVPSFVFLMLRLAIATPILWIAGFIMEKKSILYIKSKKELIYLILSGIFSVTINQSLFLVGLNLSTASNAAITQPAIPVFATVFGVFLGYERKTKLKFLGIAIAVIGCILMVDLTHLTSENSSSNDILLGNLCFLGNTIAYALFLMVQKPLSELGVSAIKCISWSFIFGSPPVILISLLITDNMSDRVASITVWPWMAILYCAILATAYCFFASSWAVAKSSATNVAIYLCVEPLATGILATVFLDEVLTPLNIVGGIVMIGGVATVMVSKYREKKKDELDNFEKEKLKQYDMNNGIIELSSINNNNNNNNNNSDDNNNNLSNSETIINISKENSYSKIISSNSIIGNNIDDDDDNDNNDGNQIQINKNIQLNQFNNNNNNNNNNNLLNKFRQVGNNNSNNIDDDDDDSLRESNLNESSEIKGGGSILVF